MSLKVDTNKISEEVKRLDKCIKDYNNNCYEMFYEISKIDSCWKGENKDFFLEKMEKEKNQNLLIIDCMDKISNFYKEVELLYSKYNNDGK